MPALSCPICQSSSVTLLNSPVKDYVTSSEFQVWQCGNCQIAFTAPQPDDMSRYYPDRYRKYNKAVVWLLGFLYELRAKRWSNWFQKPGTAFEMGCGNGIMLSTLRRHGWQVAGNERTVSAAAFARQSLNLPVFVGELDALTQHPFADLVILFQVLEHLPYPISTLTAIHRLMKSDGKLVIGVPNIRSWQAKFGGALWFHLDVPRHLFHFSVPSLEYCLAKTGFKILKVGFQSPEHDPFGWIQTILNRTTGKQNHLTKVLMGLERSQISTVLHFLLAVFAGIISLPLSLTSWILNRGAIMEVIAEKKDL